jgi:hypothetical protein
MSGGRFRQDEGWRAITCVPFGYLNALTVDEICTLSYLNREVARRWLRRAYLNGEIKRDTFGKFHVYYRDS